jgi:hypothetical protein
VRILWPTPARRANMDLIDEVRTPWQVHGDREPAMDVDLT